MRAPDAPVRLQMEGFSQDDEVRAVRAVSQRIGGVATFIGCARDFSEGRVSVKSLLTRITRWRWPNCGNCARRLSNASG